VSHLTDQETADLASVPEGTTLLNVDAAGVEARLESNPWILDASVERWFPSTLNLNIKERQIVAVVDVVIDDNDNQQTWALASDGTWLMQIPDRESDEGKLLADQIYEDADEALHISSVPYGSVPEAGSQCSNPNITNALAIIDGMSTELADQVKSVSAASSDSTMLTLDNGIEIAFGDSSNIRDKERVCLELMEEYPDKIAYINVRTVNKPIWRAV
jgi:cell division protein FtsQ